MRMKERRVQIVILILSITALLFGFLLSTESPLGDSSRGLRLHGLAEEITLAVDVTSKRPPVAAAQELSPQPAVEPPPPEVKAILDEIRVMEACLPVGTLVPPSDWEEVP